MRHLGRWAMQMMAWKATLESKSKTVKETNKRRKSPAGDHNGSKPHDAVRTVDDTSNPEIAVVRRKNNIHLTYKTDTLSGNDEG
ncbi:MAG: hypothetical protein Q9198_007843 [Flavoplaca austrocitrina]